MYRYHDKFGLGISCCESGRTPVTFRCVFLRQQGHSRRSPKQDGPYSVQTKHRPTDKQRDARMVEAEPESEPSVRIPRSMSAMVTRSSKPKCLIFGAGGHGRVVLDILNCVGDHEVVGFVDSDAQLKGRRIDGVRVLGTPADLPRIRDEESVHLCVVAVGDNGARRALGDHLRRNHYELINAIHPSANLASNVSLGRNIVIAAGVLVGAHGQIGDSVILNTGSIVDHESLIGTASHICPGARLAGRVTVESGAFIGIGATVIQSIRVGYEAMVGAGAVVVQDVAPMSTVVGVPARQIKCGPVTMQAREWLVPELVHQQPTDSELPVALPAENR